MCSATAGCLKEGMCLCFPSLLQARVAFGCGRSHSAEWVPIAALWVARTMGRPHRSMCSTSRTSILRNGHRSGARDGRCRKCRKCCDTPVHGRRKRRARRVPDRASVADAPDVEDEGGLADTCLPQVVVPCMGALGRTGIDELLGCFLSQVATGLRSAAEIWEHLQALRVPLLSLTLLPMPFRTGIMPGKTRKLKGRVGEAHLFEDSSVSIAVWEGLLNRNIGSCLRHARVDQSNSNSM